MERVADLGLNITVEDDTVIGRRPDDPTRDYAVEVAVLLRALADAMAHDTTREKAWDLAEFLISTVTLPRPDWSAIELCASELAALAAKRRPSEA